ncbi:TPA: hypothetical protein ENX78_14100 [Candidatus Poribacteria bacterium]|nr:hypothetical protein [Candidatus Poribacteria bacterium]
MRLNSVQEIGCDTGAGLILLGVPWQLLFVASFGIAASQGREGVENWLGSVIGMQIGGFLSPSFNSQDAPNDLAKNVSYSPGNIEIPLGEGGSAKPENMNQILRDWIKNLIPDIDQSYVIKEPNPMIDKLKKFDFINQARREAFSQWEPGKTIYYNKPYQFGIKGHFVTGLKDALSTRSIMPYQLGGFDVMIKINPEGVATFQISNVTNIGSALYHITIPSLHISYYFIAPTTGAQSYQTFIWTENVTGGK